MPLKQEVLKKIKEDNDLTAYYETGINAGDSFITATAIGFEKLIGVEINAHFTYRIGCMLRPLTQIKQCLFMTGDSAMVDPARIDDFIGDRKAVFFLDAHLDSGLDSAPHLPQATCPLRYELEIISKLKRKDHVILIDDLRILTDTRYGAWKTNDYDIPSEKFPMETIIPMLNEINGDYIISTVTGDDRFPDDVLYVRVPNGKNGAENG